MRLSWHDAVTTLLAIAGGAVVYAKFYDYSWAVIGSWRSASLVLAGIGVLMFAFSRFDFGNFSWLNVGEMIVSVVALGLAITALFVISEFLFYTLAAVMGTLWLVDTARHLRHSLIDDNTTSFHHHAPAH